MIWQPNWMESPDATRQLEREVIRAAGLAYTLRDIDPKLWHAVKVKALSKRTTVKDVILTLLTDWAKP